MTHTPIATVFVREGSVYANSRDVAAYFEKRHDHVLRDIERLQEEAGERLPNFGESFVDVDTGNGAVRRFRTYEMNKDGFVLLAMSFTGPKALKFKLAYISAFNAMEDSLKEPAIEGAPLTALAFDPDKRALVSEARRIWGNQSAAQLWSKLGLERVPAMTGLLPQTEMVFTATLTAANQNGRYLAA